MNWNVRWDEPARHQLASLDPVIRARVLKAIARLAADPHGSAQVKTLRGTSDYRLRVGHWRVVYELRPAELILVVIRVAHRREVYRQP